MKYKKIWTKLYETSWFVFNGCPPLAGIELKHLCLEYMTPWLLNLVRFCKHNDDAKRQRVTAILDKLITMTINEKQMYPSIQAKIWGSLGQVSQPAVWRSLNPVGLSDL